MKKQLFIGLAILVGGFIACNEDDEPKYDNINRIGGEWTLTKIGSLNSANSLNYENVAGDCASTLSFADSTFVENKSMIVDGNCQTETTTGNYRIENGDLVREISGSADESDDILRLTDTELELVHNDAETSELTFLVYTKQTPIGEE